VVIFSILKALEAAEARRLVNARKMEGEVGAAIVWKTKGTMLYTLCTASTM